jgi:hypothetical protein
LKKDENKMSNQISETMQTQTELHVYPNPDNPTVCLFFGVPKNYNGKIADIKIYNLLGDLVWGGDEAIAPGLNKIVWSGVDKDNHAFADGRYVVRISLGDRNLEQIFSLAGRKKFNKVTCLK